LENTQYWGGKRAILIFPHGKFTGSEKRGVLEKILSAEWFGKGPRGGKGKATKVFLPTRVWGGGQTTNAQSTSHGEEQYKSFLGRERGGGVQEHNPPERQPPEGKNRLTESFRIDLFWA